MALIFHSLILFFCYRAASAQYSWAEQRDDLSEYKLDSSVAGVRSDLECATLAGPQHQAVEFDRERDTCRLYSCQLGTSGCRKCRNARNSTLPLLLDRWAVQRDDLSEYKLDSSVAGVRSDLECATLAGPQHQAVEFDRERDTCRLYSCQLGTSGCRKCRNARNSTLPLLLVRQLDELGRTCWRTFQHRVDGSVDFYRNWTDYLTEFGQGEDRNYWMGLEAIHQLTRAGDRRARWEMSDWNGTRYWWETLTSLCRTPGYRVSVGEQDLSKSNVVACSHSSPYFLNGSMFSTMDRDQDAGTQNCAISYHGAWWYANCHCFNPNGKYFEPPFAFNQTQPYSGVGISFMSQDPVYPFVHSYSMNTTASSQLNWTVQRDDLSEYKLDSSVAGVRSDLECATLARPQHQAIKFDRERYTCRLYSCQLGTSGCRKCRNARNSTLPLLLVRQLDELGRTCWRTFQHRVDGSVDFYRNWTNYLTEFGQGEDRNYWMGLEAIHQLTRAGDRRVRWEMSDWNGTRYWWEDATSPCRTPVKDTESASESLMSAGRIHTVGAYMNNAMFSTQDKDQDTWSSNCAVTYQGAWWYGSCHCFNPNGRYFTPPAAFYLSEPLWADGLTFSSPGIGYPLNHYYSMKTFECMSNLVPQALWSSLPGSRQGAGAFTKHQQTNNQFSPVDYVVLGVFLAASLAVGIVASFIGRRKGNAEDGSAGSDEKEEFVMGGRKQQVIPVALSLLVSFNSAILILGGPAEIYFNGTMYVLSIFGEQIGCVLAALIFVPVFYQLRLTSSFEYLELRFKSRLVRLMGNFLLLINNGGLKAVIWTDVFQSVVMTAGILAIIIRGLIDLGGIGNVWQISYKYGRIEFDNLDPRVRHTVWGLVVGNGIAYSSTFGVFQASVQRYCSVKTMRQAQLSVVLVSLGAIFFVVSSCLAGLIIFAYYANVACDPSAAGWIEDSNQIVPFYVMENLRIPVVPGLFIASLFAGALSSVSSSLSALAATTWEDFFKPYCCLNATEARATWINRLFIVFYGVSAVFMGLISTRFGGTVLQASLAFTGSFGAPLLGLFSMGVLFPFVNKYGALVGSVCGLIISGWLSIGSYLNGKQLVGLPTNISNCDVGTPGTTLLPTTVGTTQAPVVEPLDDWYSLSYVWFPIIGSAATTAGGFIVSLFTRGYREEVDEAFINPYFVRFYKFLSRSCNINLMRAAPRNAVQPVDDAEAIEVSELSKQSNSPSRQGDDEPKPVDQSEDEVQPREATDEPKPIDQSEDEVQPREATDEPKPIDQSEDEVQPREATDEPKPIDQSEDEVQPG
uniref:Fibrinogen C-terminal domain-containing protein n=1 Tax=Macrostomum lignano TaxID=282301 RepID=A0A1I8HZN8_9PLAT